MAGVGPPDCQFTPVAIRSLWRHGRKAQEHLTRYCCSPRSSGSCFTIWYSPVTIDWRMSLAEKRTVCPERNRGFMFNLPNAPIAHPWHRSLRRVVRRAAALPSFNASVIRGVFVRAIVRVGCCRIWSPPSGPGPGSERNSESGLSMSGPLGIRGASCKERGRRTDSDSVANLGSSSLTWDLPGHAQAGRSVGVSGRPEKL